MIAYELSVKQTDYLGVGEALSCGIFNISFNIFMAIYIIILTPFLE